MKTGKSKTINSDNYRNNFRESNKIIDGININLNSKQMYTRKQIEKTFRN